jgi:8-oxo-dGTP pyrophosphatase MutT (NUDIX family)
MFIKFNKEIKNNEELVSYLKDIGLKLPEYRCAVIALFLDTEGRILLQRRGPKSRDEVNKLEDIGGAVEEQDKSFRDAMNREIIEEAGDDFNFTIDELVGASLITKYDSRTDNDVNWFFLLYKCTYIDGELHINEPGMHSSILPAHLSRL